MMQSWYKKHRSGLMVAVLAVLGFAFQPLSVMAQDDDEDGQREPPDTRQSDVLSEPVYRQISDIQEMMNPEDDDEEPDLEGAKEELDDLNEDYDSLNDFEKATLLNFYSTYYIQVDDIENAINSFQRMLDIENLREEQRLRALRSLGQLYASTEQYQLAIDMLTRWRELSEEEDRTVYLMLANSYYNLDQYEEAIPHLLSHIDMMEAQERDISRNIYSLLNLMYIELEQYENALETTRTMVAMFDEPADWRNLAAVYGYLDEDQARVQALELTYQKGYFDSEGQFMNLAQSLAGLGAPWRGLQVLEDGIEQGYVEENFDNLERLTQMYMMASEYEGAIDPAQRAAEVADNEESGDAYDYLGYIHYMNNNYEESVEAMQQAVEIGGLSDPGDSYMFLARGLVELDRFEEARDAAEQARELGNDNANQYLSYIDNTQERFETLQQRREEASEFYRPADA